MVTSQALPDRSDYAIAARVVMAGRRHITKGCCRTSRPDYREGLWTCAEKWSLYGNFSSRVKNSSR
jgi:hypothetical protein